MDISEREKLVYEQTSENFRKTWEIYIKFYTVFLTINIAGLGLVVQYIDDIDNRWPIVAAFVAQNILVAGTSLGMSIYTTHLAKQLLSIATPASIPGPLAKWAGFSNAIACIFLVVCWWFVQSLEISTNGA